MYARIIILLALILIATPFAYRAVTDEPLPGYLTYNSITIAQHHTYRTPYEALVTFASYFIPPYIIPVLLSLILAPLFIYMLSKGISNTVFLLLIALSPTLITTGIFLPGHLLALILFAAGYYYRNSWISLPFFILFSLFSIVHTIIAGIFVGYWYHTQRQRLHSILLILITTTIFITPFYSYHVLPTKHIESLSSDLGGVFGMSIFFIILTIIGIFHSWKHKKENIPRYALLAALLAAFILFDQQFLIYLLIPCALFAAEGFLWISQRRWMIPSLKSLTLLIIFCGLIFSTLTAVKEVSIMAPHSLEPFTWLAQQPRGTVVTSPATNYLVAAVSKQPIMSEDLSSLFASRNLDSAKSILATHDVSYILVTKEMREGETWTVDDEGLLFLLNDPDAFKLIYDEYGVKIWNTTFK